MLESTDHHITNHRHNNIHFRSSNAFIRIIVILLSITFLNSTTVNAHSRWKCPQPRNVATDITFGGPCGDETNDFTSSSSDGEVTLVEIAPGPMLVQWEEAVSHNGSPFRISLSQDDTDTELPVCILLDHIPHNDDQNPNIDDESTYTVYSMVILIPDIACTRCSLHLANIRTADEEELGAPNGAGCTDPDGTCNTVYRSCTIPFTITGTTPRSEYTCPNINPIDWPTEWIGDDGAIVTADTIGLYRRESGIWDDTFLQDVPDFYRTVDDSVTLCNVINDGNMNPSESPTTEGGGGGILLQIFFSLLNLLLRLLGFQ